MFWVVMVVVGGGGLVLIHFTPDLRRNLTNAVKQAPI